MAESTTLNCMLRLPGEITSMIFSELSARDIQRSRAVCRHFRDHMDHPPNQSALIRTLEARSSAARGKLVKSLLGTGNDDFLDHLLRFLFHRGLTVPQVAHPGYALMLDDLLPFMECFNYRRPSPIPRPDTRLVVRHIVNRLLYLYGFGPTPASMEQLKAFILKRSSLETIDYFLPRLERWEDAIQKGRVTGLSHLNAIKEPRFAYGCNCRPDLVCIYKINLPARQQRFSWDRGLDKKYVGLNRCLSQHRTPRFPEVSGYDRVCRLFELEDLPVPGLLYCTKDQWASEWIGKALNGAKISPLLRTAILEEITVF